MHSRIATIIRKREDNPGKVYKDHLGNLTCGWGHLLQPGSVFPVAAAEILFQHDFQDALHTAQQVAPERLSEARFAVLVDMAFQMGGLGLRHFSKMFDCLRQEDYRGAADEILDSAYAKQTPGRAKKNATMMAHNCWIEGEL